MFSFSATQDLNYDDESPRKIDPELKTLDIPVACDNATTLYQLQHLAAEGYHSTSHSQINCTR